MAEYIDTFEWSGETPSTKQKLNQQEYIPTTAQNLKPISLSTSEDVDATVSREQMGSLEKAQKHIYVAAPTTRKLMSGMREDLGLKSDYKPDPNFDVLVDEDVHNMMREYNFDQDMIQNLFEAEPVSKQHAVDIINHERNVLQLHNELTSGSAAGTATQFVAGMADPTIIASALIPVAGQANSLRLAYSGAKSAIKAGNAVKAMGMYKHVGSSFAQGFAIEGALHKITNDISENLSYKNSDSILAGVMAGGIGGTIDGFSYRGAIKKGKFQAKKEIDIDASKARMKSQEELLEEAFEQSSKELSEIKPFQERAVEIKTQLKDPNVKGKRELVDELNAINLRMDEMTPEGRALRSAKKKTDKTYRRWAKFEKMDSDLAEANNAVKTLSREQKSVAKQLEAIDRKIEGYKPSKPPKEPKTEKGLDSWIKKQEAYEAKVKSKKDEMASTRKNLVSRRKEIESELNLNNATISKATSEEWVTKRGHAEVAKKKADDLVKIHQDSFDEVLSARGERGVEYIDNAEYLTRMHKANVIESARNWIKDHKAELPKDKLEELNKVMTDTDNNIASTYVKESKEMNKKVLDWFNEFDKNNAPTHLIEDVEKFENMSLWNPMRFLWMRFKPNYDDQLRNIYAGSIREGRDYRGEHAAFGLMDRMMKSVTGNVSDRVGIVDADAIRMGYNNAFAKVIHQGQNKVAKELGVDTDQVRELMSLKMQGYDVGVQSKSLDDLVSKATEVNKQLEAEAFNATGEKSFNSNGSHLPRVINLQKLENVTKSVRDAVYKEDPSISIKDAEEKVFTATKQVVYNSMKSAVPDAADEVLDQIAHAYTSFMKARIAGKNGEVDIKGYINRNVKEKYRGLTIEMSEMFSRNKSDTIDLEDVINQSVEKVGVGRDVMSTKEFDAKVKEYVEQGKTKDEAVSLVQKESKRARTKADEGKQAALKSRFKMDLMHKTTVHGVPVSMSDIFITDAATLFTRKTAYIGDVSAKARAGLPWKQSEFDELIDKAVDELEANGASLAERSEYRSMIEQADRNMKGLPNWSTSGTEGKFNDIMAAAKIFTFASTLTKAVVPALFESVRVAALTDSKYMLKMPAMTRMRNNFIKGTADEQEEMARNMVMFGAANDSRYGNMFHNVDDMEDLTPFEAGLKTFRRKGNHVAGIALGMSHADMVTRNFANMVIRQNLIEHIANPKKVELRFGKDEIGLTGESWNRVKKLVDEHAVKGEYGIYYLDMKGKVSQEMEVALADFRSAVDVGQRTAIQRAYTGEGYELSWGSATEFINLLLQFQRFGIDSFNKQYRRDTNFARMVNKEAGGFKGSQMLAKQWSLLYGASVLGHIGKSFYGVLDKDNKMERLEKALDPSVVAFSALRNHSAAGFLVSKPMEVAGYLDTAFGDGTFAENLSYYKTGDHVTIPVVDYMNNLGKAAFGDERAMVRVTPTHFGKAFVNMVVSDE